MGYTLRNPIIAGASSLTSRMESIRKLEESGVGALVVKSLFEEQIKLEEYRLEGELHKNDDLHPEMITVFPDLKHAGPDEHLGWVRQAKEELTIPVIGSLNAVNKDMWVDYAKKLAETGIDMLELNIYELDTSLDRSAESIEKEQVEAVKAVVQSLDIPVSVKIAPYYSSPLNFIKRLSDAGASGLVLFNRLFQPSINHQREENDYSLNLSGANAYRLPLRFAGLLHGRMDADVCVSGGINSADTIIKSMLAGAPAVQMVSALYSQSMVIVPKILGEMKEWMSSKGYSSTDEFIGKLSYKNNPNPELYTRAQYARALLHPEQYIRLE
jgi:dihydroorotate dehydrogenase (fumarate)